MALATQCPHCQTVFRVAADQLKLRAGLVRCGACKQIFNGIEHLVPQSAAAPSTARPATSAAPAPATAPVAAPAVVPAASSAFTPPATSASALDFVPMEGADEQPQSIETGPAVPAPETLAAEETEDPLQGMTIVNLLATEEEKDELPTSIPAPPEASETAVEEPRDVLAEPNEARLAAEEAIAETPSTETEPATNPPASIAPDEAEGDHVPPGFDDEDEQAVMPPSELAASEKQVEEENIAPLAAGDEAVNEAEAEAEAEADNEESDEDEAYEPGFVTRDKRRQRFSRVSRIFLSLGSFLLMLGLAAQGAYFFRNQLAAWFPQSKPLLAELCLVAGCQVQLPTQIDMVSIESSELQATAPNRNVFTLTVLLRNRSGIAQAWPNIELTLNDTNEKAVARRVLKPREYLTSGQEAAKGLSAGSEQAVKVTFELDQIKASGYRVYLFYS